MIVHGCGVWLPERTLGAYSHLCNLGILLCEGENYVAFAKRSFVVMYVAVHLYLRWAALLLERVILFG